MGVSAMVVGPNKGHKVTKLAGHKGTQSRNKGMKTKKSAFVHDVIREVVGYWKLDNVHSKNSIFLKLWHFC